MGTGRSSKAIGFEMSLEKFESTCTVSLHGCDAISDLVNTHNNYYLHVYDCNLTFILPYYW